MAKSGKGSIKHKAVDTIVTRKEPKQDSSQRKPLYFGAGLGMHQLLPIAGQKSNPYNALGRKSSLGDYILLYTPGSTRIKNGSYNRNSGLARLNTPKRLYSISINFWIQAVVFRL